MAARFVRLMIGVALMMTLVLAEAYDYYDLDDDYYDLDDDFDDEYYVPFRRRPRGARAITDAPAGKPTKKPEGEFKEEDRFMVRTKTGSFVQLEKDKEKGGKHLKRVDTFTDPELIPDLVHWFHFPSDLKAKGLIPPKDLIL